MGLCTLPEKLDAFQTLIEIHYRYYQLHANLLVALAFAYGARFFATPWRAYRVGAVDLGFMIVSVILFLGSRMPCGSITAGPANCSPSPAKGGES